MAAVISAAKAVFSRPIFLKLVFRVQRQVFLITFFLKKASKMFEYAYFGQKH